MSKSLLLGIVTKSNKKCLLASSYFSPVPLFDLIDTTQVPWTDFVKVYTGDFY